MSPRPIRPDFDEVYRAELRYVYNALRRLGIPLRDLEDVTHDVFVVVHRQLPQYDPARPLRPWLFGIAFRVASTHRRKHSHHKERLREGDPPHGEHRTEDPWVTHPTRDLVARALARVDLEPRAVLILHDIDRATAKEIARELEMPVNRVYSRLRIARRDFKAAVLALQEGEAREC